MIADSVYPQVVSIQFSLGEDGRAIVDINESFNVSDERERILNLLVEITVIGGYMQKAGEELDHTVGLEKEKLVTQTMNRLVVLLIAGKAWRVDYSFSVPKRWEEIARRTVIKEPQ